MRSESVRVDAEHPIAMLELGDGRADCVDLSGELGAEDRPSRPQQSAEETNEPGSWITKSAVRAVHRRRVHLDEDLVVLGRGPLDISDAEHLGRPVPLVHDCFHDGAGMFDTER